ncbi:hypothetical protein [Pseudochrobactrum kiredjianiae]|uniref:Uncharacterized protein n=1 Tax=Pseudochrobactrum kiredjianiae TaxID=386305 RepID=A0ABW3V745_9HYPH|nr:hypothetical protein [Pseudochrobactrum kiredjianiae]MDM7849965.1 hypothetical protein [Pseudochrobactrum kiredjianiae]
MKREKIVIDLNQTEPCATGTEIARILLFCLCGSAATHQVASTDFVNSKGI